MTTIVYKLTMDKKAEYPTSIRLTAELRDALQRRAEAATRSLNNYIVHTLREHVAATPEPAGTKRSTKSRKS